MSNATDEELLERFAAGDTDGSGEIDIDGFVTFLESDPLAEDMSFKVFGEAMIQLVQLWVKRKEEEQYAMFLEHLFKLHLNSKYSEQIKNTRKGVFFWDFYILKIFSFYQQFSPSPIGTQVLDFAASSAIF